MQQKIYLCIDLKSFYASVECIERGLDAMTTNLVVADNSRTEKTICLAVSPSLKSFGIPGRPRLYEVIEQVKRVNKERQKNAPSGKLQGESYDICQLNEHKDMAVSYLVAPPRMAYYTAYSTRIYEIYLKYIAPEDIHVYSIDEVFIDITRYLKTYKKTPRQLAMTMILDVLKETGITATAGIGTNMYLAKVAMDIVAKKQEATKDGVRIAELDEMSYRKILWQHRPLTDFWRVGKGIAKKLEAAGLHTMGDVARESLTEYGEDRLYKLFGVGAEFLIDHAWGWEPCELDHIRKYQPETKSIGSGQVLHCPYSFEKAKIIAWEMTELLVLELVEKKLVSKQFVLTVGYDIDNLKDGRSYKGEITVDAYGRKVPKHAHGTTNLDFETSSTKLITKAVMELYDRIVAPSLSIRRINITAGNVLPESAVSKEKKGGQLDFFTDYETLEADEEKKTIALEKERKIQEAVLLIKKQFGKNAILKGINLEEGATAKDRNEQIGGHKA
ncbi:MAG: DNA methylase [Clostridia bacterium]|nr:DNA methylase [Clostridia bacterium]